MKTNEHPILFSGPMVRAILDGRKTQTRRVNGLEDVNHYHGRLSGNGGLGTLGYKGLMKSDLYLKPKKEFKRNPGLFHWFVGEQDREINPIPVKCPYGAIGDRLWVKETMSVEIGATKSEIECGHFTYKADDTRELWVKESGYRNIPSLYMPRWASRINLEIINIRVERLQSIIESAEGERDAMAEGCPEYPLEESAGEWFRGLWNSINESRGYGWDSNPFVWVIEFKKL